MRKLRGNNGKPKAGTPSERFEGLSPRRWVVEVESVLRSAADECRSRTGAIFPTPGVR